MFAKNFWGNRFYAVDYWANVGATIVIDVAEGFEFELPIVTQAFLLPTVTQTFVVPENESS